MITKKLNITVQQGATFTKSVHWYGGGKVSKVIADLTPGNPTQVEVTAHGLPSASDTPVYIAHVKGAYRANTPLNQPVLASYIDVDNFYIDADTTGQTYTASTGSLTYFAPKNLVGWTARMHIRETVDSTTTIVELTSAGGDITISTNDAKITVVIADTATDDFDFDNAVYDLELEDVSGNVTRLLEGTVVLSREVTR